jgi:hypothetical protein
VSSGAQAEPSEQALKALIGGCAQCVTWPYRGVGDQAGRRRVVPRIDIALPQA